MRDIHAHEDLSDTGHQHLASLVNGLDYRLILDDIERGDGSSGTDGLAGDPLSAMQLSNGALWRAVEQVVGLAEAAVVLGGGGYNPWTLARCWTGLWGRLAGESLPTQLPDAALDVLKGLACDLIDEDELRESWLTTLCDAPNNGPVRDEVSGLSAALAAAGSGRTGGGNGRMHELA